MHSLKQALIKFYVNIRHYWLLLGVAVAFLLLGGCNQVDDDLLARLDNLQTVVKAQSKAINDLEKSQRKLQTQLSEYQDIRFVVDGVQYELIEKAFEPLLMGEAKLSIAGDQKPDLIFVEWTLNFAEAGKELGSMSYIQRVENGEAVLSFSQPLPRHNIETSQLSLKIEPTAWYLGHMAHLQ
ncbi:MAG: hypothetical protein CSA49_05835 [Gammaproteobacteria bacterium]|nr:MAG: hypothetical protein CSA49_05835 [Gammaproteobacteria bacterium]